MFERRSMSLAAVLSLALPLAALAQSPAPPHQHGTPAAAEQAPMMEKSMMEKCRAMMAQHEQMEERMTAAQAELDGLVTAMRSVRGKAKVDAMAALLEKLVEQPKSMHAGMMQHHAKMMQHMMEHEGSGEGLASCPMMQRMHEKAEPESAEGHSKHGQG
jgi:hypothetical protein